MTHEEAMRTRWFQCWYYPCWHHRSPHYLENKREWELHWAKDIRKEARAYLKAFNALTPTQHKILRVNAVMAEQAQALLNRR